MPRPNTATRARPDPDAARLRAVRARLDALDALAEPTAAEAAELARLWVIWAHTQPTLAMRTPRRSAARRPK